VLKSSTIYMQLIVIGIEMYARWQHVEIVYKEFCYNIIFHDVFPFYKLRQEYKETWLICQGYILWYEMCPKINLLRYAPILIHGCFSVPLYWFGGSVNFT